MTRALKRFFVRHHRIGIDSNIIIARLEKNPAYLKELRQLFEQFDEYQSEIWLSTVSIPEILIHPLRRKRADLAAQYEQFFSRNEGQFAEVTLSAARLATTVGVQYKLAVRDALIIGSLLEQGVTGFITADRDFKRVKTPEVLFV